MSQVPKAKGEHGFASWAGCEQPPSHAILLFPHSGQLPSPWAGRGSGVVGLWAQEDFASHKRCPGLERPKKTADLAYGKLCFLARLLSHR